MSHTEPSHPEHDVKLLLSERIEIMINIEERQDYQEIVRDIARVVNMYSLEQESQTPDYILAEYMLKSLSDLNRLMRDRDYWYGERGAIGMGQDKCTK